MIPSIDPTHSSRLTRRRFLSAGAAWLGLASLPKSVLAGAVAQAADDFETMTWSACAVNCGSRCQLRVFSRHGRVIRIESDASGSAGASTVTGGFPQVRACQRGRAMRQRIYAAERLKTPLRRVGPRGSGRFEPVSWEEALDEIAARLSATIKKHTNESVFVIHGSGNQALVNNVSATHRFFNLIGGSAAWHSDYSAGCIQHAWPYLYGRFDYGAVRSKAAGAGSYMTQIANAELYVTFGNNPAVTRASGGGQSWELFSALRKSGTRMIVIDPILNDTLAGRDAEWIPIRPGTDAALCEAIAYVLITENLVDEGFLRRYTVGYDEDSLPASAPKGASYKSHILGLGPDKTPKTPARASTITEIPEDRIISLARAIGTAKPCFISQGWAPQRRMNGETQSTSIAMLAILTGQIGLPGTNSGAREGDSYGIETGLPTFTNPVKPSFPIFLWPQAVLDGPSLTAENAGVRNAPALRHSIKFIWCTQSNTLVNQHGGANQVARLLEDESLVETIVCVDTQMTPSARYADFVLPDVCHQESVDLMADSYAVGGYNYLCASQKAIEPEWEQRPNYEIMRGMARRFGVEEAYTEGRSLEDWVRWCYEETRRKRPDVFPDYETFQKEGIVKYHMDDDSGIVMEDFRRDPDAHPLETPSGKIEIYSERLAELARRWELPDEKGQEIPAIPRFVPTLEMIGQGDPAEKDFPLEAFGYHGPGRTHSTYHNVPWLRDLHPDVVLMNPVDAAPRGLVTGDKVRVFNRRGSTVLPVKVTPRIIPRLVAFPQGAWYAPDGKGVDRGGCFNVLTQLRPTPLAKANPSHTNLVEVEKFEEAAR